MTPNRPSGLPVALWIALVTASAATAAVLWLTDWTLGVPGEWSWKRIVHPEASRWDRLLGGIQAGLTLGGVGLAAWFGSRLMTRQSQPRALSKLARAALLLGLVASGFLGLQLLLHSLPPGHGIGRSPWVLYYPGSSGYYYEARKVTWPTRRETAITTVMVFVMVAVSSIFFLLADQVIRLLITTLLSIAR